MKKRIISLLLAVSLLSGSGILPSAAAVETGDEPAQELVFDKTISAGSEHMVVIKEDGSVWTWGYTEGGRLGSEEDAWVFNGEPDCIPEVYYHAEPARVLLDKPAVSVSAGSSHTAVITSDGELWNWGGHNAYGGLGREAEGNFIPPGRVMDHAREVSNGSLHTAVLTDDGVLWTFGGNIAGQIGNGGKGELFEGLRVSYNYQRLPIPVLDDVKTVTAGGNRTYAIRNDGSLWAWGDNDGGILGNGNFISNEMLGGYFHKGEEQDAANALLGEVYTVTFTTREDGWGHYVQPDGGLAGMRYGAGTREEVYVAQKTPIKIMDGVKQVSTGLSSSLILKTDGTVWRTAHLSHPIYGEDGYMTGKYSNAPEQMPIDDVVAVDSSTSYAAIRSDGSLWTWGENLYSELGRGDISYAEEDIPGKALEDVVDVSVGNGFMAALKSDGSLWMAGANGLGQLGGATDEAESNVFIKVMDGVALPASYTRSRQTIRHGNVPASFIQATPVQQEQAPVWDTTPWTDRVMNIPDFAVQFNGNTYAFCSWQDCTWDQAQSYCLSVGGHLATITTPEEQEFVSWVGDPHWIGARRNPQGNWSWVTGESWGYNAWHPGQNDNYGGFEDAANVWGNGWNDVSNNVVGTVGFICEWETAGRRLPTPPAPIYSVTFNTAEGSSLNTIRKQVTLGQSYGWLPTPTLPGWSFLGWYDAPEGGKLITSSSVVNLKESQHLYAMWTSNTGGPTVPRISYSFSNSSYAFNYPEGFKIPLDRYLYMFGNQEFAADTFNAEEAWTGSCGGMCGTSSMLYMNNVAGISPGAFRSGASLAGELKVGDVHSGLNMTLRDWIECVQVSQGGPIIQNQAAKTTNDYNGLVHAVMNFQETGRDPVIIWIWGPPGKGGHAVIGLAAWRKDNTTDCITVYDPNRPNNVNRFIDLYRNAQGQYVGWYYHMNDELNWGTNYQGNIQYVYGSTYTNAWNSRGSQASVTGVLTVNSPNASVYDYAGNLVATVRDGEVESLRSDVFPAAEVPAGAGSGADGVTLWIPCEYFSVVNEDKDVKTLSVSVSGEESSVSVSTSADSLLVYGGGKDSVALIHGDDDSYEIVLTDREGERTLTGKTQGSNSACLALINGGLRSTGVRPEDGQGLTVNGKAAGADVLRRTTLLDVVTSTGAGSISATFADVPGDSYYAPAVRWAYDSKVTGGTGSGAFSPDRSLTRAEAVSLLWRAAGCPVPTAEVTPFADIREGDYFYQAVLWAVGSGVIVNTDSNYFFPGKVCSNLEYITSLWQLLGTPGQGSELAGYEDGGVWAENQGLLKSTGAQDDLNAPCLRRDAVTFLYRAMA